MQTDRIRDEPVVGGVGRIDRPAQSMRIPEAIGPDFLAGSRRRDERVVVGNPVPAVVAHGARRRVLVQIGNDAKNFSFEVVEPLRVGSDRDVRRFARRAVAAFHVEHAPVGIAATRRWIEDQIPHRMAAGVELNSQQFACCTFERGVGRIRVRPLDEHALVLQRTGRSNRVRRLVTGDVQCRKPRVVWQIRAGQGRIFDVDCVEPAVARIVGIEIEAVQAVPVSLRDRQLVEDAGLPRVAVEIEVHRKLLRRLVEHIERSVQIADEESLGAADLFAQRVHAREQKVVGSFSVDEAGHRRFDVVLDVERHLCRRRRRATDGRGDDQPRDVHRGSHHPVLIDVCI